MTRRAYKYLQKAVTIAERSTSRARLGAVLVSKNRVVGLGFNQMKKTHPKQERFNTMEEPIGLHAEVHACIGVPTPHLQGSTLYIARLLKNGNLAMSKPCESCRRFLIFAEVRRVIYTISNSEIGVMEL